MQYRFEAYCFDPAPHELCHAGQPVPLRPQACELLAYLLQPRDRVVSKEEELAQVWPGQYVGDGALHACMLAVRTALHDTGRIPSLLHTVWGRGYRFVAPMEVCDLPLDAPPPARPFVQAELVEAPCSLPAGSAPAAVVGTQAEGQYKLVGILCGALAVAPALAARRDAEGLSRLLQTVVELIQEGLCEPGRTGYPHARGQSRGYAKE
jgi:DNA-binding winged helix-turn-helix (wHTH) protein